MEDLEQLHNLVLRRLNNGPTSGQLQTDSIVRPFTLQEALPYTPQTSTVPFASCTCYRSRINLHLREAL